MKNLLTFLLMLTGIVLTGVAGSAFLSGALPDNQTARLLLACWVGLSGVYVVGSIFLWSTE